MAPSFSTVRLGEMLGYSIGLALNLLLLSVVVRWTNRPALRPGSGLAFPACLLGIVYNAASLWGMAAEPAESASLALEIAAAIALGFLPALVVHTALAGGLAERGASGRILVVSGYALSCAAALAHILNAASEPSGAAFAWLAYGFGVIGLLVPSARTAETPGHRNLVWSLAIILFCFSALHLAPGHHSGDTLIRSVLGHQASIPLTVAILVQDYRFAFIDLFVKRALTAGLTVGIGALVLVAAFPSHWAVTDQASGFLAADVFLLAACAAISLVAPALQSAVSAFVDRVLLRRPNGATILAEAERSIAVLDTEGEVLEAARAVASRTLGVRTTVETGSEGDSLFCVPVPTHDAPRYLFRVDAPPAGRRWFSEEQSLLNGIANVTARRIDGLRLHHERCTRDLREEEARRLASEAELKALRAQINPHFLFNALTTLSYWIRRSPDRAEEHLQSLTHLLRAVLRRTETDFATLGQELDLIEAYLQIEKARFESRLQVTVRVPDALRPIKLPALTLQPLVENAVKHGISRSRNGGEICISATLADRGAALCVVVSDTGQGSSPDQMAHGRRHGIGLASIEKRLKSAFGPAGSLTFVSTPDAGSVATVRIPSGRPDVAAGANPMAVAS